MDKLDHWLIQLLLGNINTPLAVKYSQQCKLKNKSWFLLMCFRFEKQRSNFVSCLERSECASKPESQYLSADKAKLRTEIQDLQVQYRTHITPIVLQKTSKTKS